MREWNGVERQLGGESWVKSAVKVELADNAGDRCPMQRVDVAAARQKTASLRIVVVVVSSQRRRRRRRQVQLDHVADVLSLIHI